MTAPLSGRVTEGISWLCDPLRSLAWRDEEGVYRLTVLGAKATRAVLPLPVAAGIAQLLRDLMVVDPGDRAIKGWRALGYLWLRRG